MANPKSAISSSSVSGKFRQGVCCSRKSDDRERGGKCLSSLSSGMPISGGRSGDGGFESDTYTETNSQSRPLCTRVAAIMEVDGKVELTISTNSDSQRGH